MLYSNNNNFFFKVSMFLFCSMKVRTNFTIIHEVHTEHLKSSGKKNLLLQNIWIQALHKF